jgi:hypothetical protein
MGQRGLYPEMQKVRRVAAEGSRIRDGEFGGRRTDPGFLSPAPYSGPQPAPEPVTLLTSRWFA